MTWYNIQYINSLSPVNGYTVSFFSRDKYYYICGSRDCEDIIEYYIRHNTKNWRYVTTKIENAKKYPLHADLNPKIYRYCNFECTVITVNKPDILIFEDNVGMFNVMLSKTLQ